MVDERRRERDLILAPNEYAFILDETKGNIVNYVGPHKTSLANTDQPVVFDSTSKRFIRCELFEAIRQFAIAPEGWYLVVKNPSQDGKDPKTGTANSLPDLDVGKKVNIPGPMAFVPWPGQMVRVLQGHHLRSNQYLIVRVYDEEAAKKNWKKAVIKLQNTEGSDASKKNEGELDLTMGKQIVIKGTEVSFYIPSTGVEVVIDADGEYVRNAATLERLEYCILLDENGNKRFIKGPAVVFPEPTEAFVEKDGARKFKAIELNEISGLYVKVIAPYEEDGKSYKVGDELFITGKDQMIYFPRPEHAIIRYGKAEVNYAVAIPAGEARYVLNRITGKIDLNTGPVMLLPDPRKEVIVRKVLTQKQVSLWFPGNQEALEYNSKLMQQIKNDKGEPYVEVDSLLMASSVAAPMSKTMKKEKVLEDGFVGDDFKRDKGYTPPRTITLDTKYEGAVSINAWTGYAFLVVSKTGNRKVVVGPNSCLLEYDETLEPIELSTGTPKTDKNLFKTVYLRVLHNKVSDIVDADTKDFCEVAIRLSYRVNFEGDSEKWFNVENYVKFLTDHMRSLLRAVIKKYGVEEFYRNGVSIIRDAILGEAKEGGKRIGRVFEENGMRIYDVEVLDLQIKNHLLSNLLIETQQKMIQQTLELDMSKKILEVTKEREKIQQEIETSKADTKKVKLELEKNEITQQRDVLLSKIETEIFSEQQKLNFALKKQSVLNDIFEAKLERDKERSDFELSVKEKEMLQRVQELQADIESIVKKAEAVSPHLIAALQQFSDVALVEKVAESMSPLAILGGKSVAEVFGQLVKGTILEKVSLIESKTPTK